MFFSDEYFEDEVKSGFFVDGMMKCFWASQLEIFEVIENICEKYDIQYFADWGTLLGAVRHGGFIPWDDDFDICMKREDYEAFLSVVSKELPEGFDVINYRNHDDYYDIMTRITNSKSIRWDEDFLERFHNCPFICGIDIFPLDYVVRDLNQREVQKELIEYVSSVADVHGQFGLNRNKLENNLKKIEKLCNCKINRFGNIKKQLYEITCNLYALYSEEESDEIAIMAKYIEKGRAIYPKEAYADTIRMHFENTSISVPIGYDAILKQKYRNYMRGVRSAVGHIYPLYDKQIEYISSVGGKFNRYKFDKSVLNECKNLSFKNCQIEKIKAAANLHEKIPFLIVNQQDDIIFKILQTCQEVAISVGEAVEKRSESTAVSVVAGLEQYCEALFEVADGMQHGNVEGGKEIADALTVITENILTEISEMPLKKEVLLVPWKAKHWERLHIIWENLTKEGVHVSVMPIPYKYKKQMGRVLTDERYEGDKFDKNIPITHYTEYDVEQMHPDEIYIVTPFDNWGYTTTVSEQFYAAELWKNTEKLTYIPWLEPDQIEPNDMRGQKSLKSLVAMPGVVRSDRIIVSSENMKNSYMECLTQWAGEETRELWADKIEVWAAPFAQDLTKNADASHIKILYFVSIVNLLEYGTQMLDKIRRNLEIFGTNRDKIQVFWVQEAYLEENLKDKAPELLAGYNEVVKGCEQEEFIKITEANDGFAAVHEVDAYYGDNGRWEWAVIDQKKPVMLQTLFIKQMQEYRFLSFNCMGFLKGKKYISSALFNGLFEIADGNDCPRLVAHFPGEKIEKQGLHNKVFCYGQKLFFFPNTSGHIHIYDPHDGKLVAIPAFQDDEKVTRCFAEWQSDEKVYIFTKDSLIPKVFDMKREAFLEAGFTFSESSVIKNDTRENACFTQGIMYEKHIYINIWMSSYIVDIYTGDHTINVMEVPGRLKICSIDYDDRGFWITAFEEKSVYLWKPGSNSLVEYYGICEAKPYKYSNIWCHAGNVFASLYRDKQIYKVNYEDQTLNPWIKLPDDFIGFHDERIKWRRFYGLQKRDQSIILYPCNANRMIEVNVESQEIYMHSCQMSLETSKAICRQIMSSKLVGGRCMEETDSRGSLETFINCLTEPDEQSDKNVSFKNKIELVIMEE